MTDLQTNKPTRGHVISALRRMVDGTEARGHYSFDRLDAGWCELAIELLIEDHDKGASVDQEQI